MSNSDALRSIVTAASRRHFGGVNPPLREPAVTTPALAFGRRRGLGRGCLLFFFLFSYLVLGGAAGGLEITGFRVGD